ncbi:hypothetical protein D3C78_1592000 [compost metagenome]
MAWLACARACAGHNGNAIGRTAGVSLDRQLRSSMARHALLLFVPLALAYRCSTDLSGVANRLHCCSYWLDLDIDTR